MSPEYRPGQDQPSRTVIIPEREILTRQLQKLGVLGMSEQSNAFFQRFTEYLGNTEANAAGIYMTWVTASADTLTHLPPIVRNSLDMYFDKVVETIVPDKQVAEEAKEVRQQVLAQLRGMAKAAEPKIQDLGPEDSLDDLNRYKQARRVADIVFEYVTSDPERSDRVWLHDDREDGANPFYHQTHRGFFLEAYYRSITKLWTPWGKYGFGGSSCGNWGEITPQILERLGATIYQPEETREYGVVGPVYALHKIDDEELPDPVERPRSVYKSYEEIKEVWEKLTKGYHESKGEEVPLTSAEKFALDDAFLAERSKNEPPLNDKDIRNLWEIAFYRGKVIKYTKDGGETWQYAKVSDTDPVYFEGGELGYHSDEEVLPNTQVHASIAITDKRFERGMVARPATEEEIKGLKFSYEFDDLKSSDSQSE